MSTITALATARHSRRILIITLAAACLSGCGGGGKDGRMSVREEGAVTDEGYYGGISAGPSAQAASREGYVAAYAVGRYSEAKSMAEEAMRGESGPSRDRAALIAGLSAHAQDQNPEAERLLLPLTTNQDRDIAGRAEACLGLVAAEASQYDKAAGLLTSAARKLPGDDGARASMFAGDALAAANRNTDAHAQYRNASANALDAGLKRAVAERLEMGNFTVQVGVYAQRVNAQRAAADIAGTAVALGIGEPRIVERHDAAGKPSYVVHVGQFTNRRQGTTAQSRLGSGWLVSLAAGQ
jgi:hypothetical protein